MVEKKPKGSLKKPKRTTAQREQKKRNLSRNRDRGHEYERKIANELKELGYPGIVTSRVESKAMDDNKIDLVDREGRLPFYPQLKRTSKIPNYFLIEKGCSLKDKPFVVFWNQQLATAQTFRSGGEIVMIPKKFFYELIKNYGSTIQATN